MGLLEELREELHAEPVTAGEPERSAAVFIAAMREQPDGVLIGGPPELHGQLAERVAREQTRCAVVEATRGNLRRVMRAMGCGDAEAAEACASVAVVAEGEAFSVSFSAPARVAAYMDAVQEGDLERAELIMYAREG